EDRVRAARGRAPCGADRPGRVSALSLRHGDGCSSMAVTGLIAVHGLACAGRSAGRLALLPPRSCPIYPRSRCTPLSEGTSSRLRFCCLPKGRFAFPRLRYRAERAALPTTARSTLFWERESPHARHWYGEVFQYGQGLWLHPA